MATPDGRALARGVYEPFPVGRGFARRSARVDVGSDRCLPRLREPGGHGGTGLGLHHVAPRLLQNLLYLDRNYDALDEKGMAASTKRRFQL